MSSASNPAAILQNDIKLKDVYHNAKSRIWIKTGAGMSDLKISVMYKGTGNLQIEKIQFKEYKVYRFSKWLGYVLMFAVIDICYYIFFSNTRHKFWSKKTCIFIGIFGITLISSMYLLTDRLYAADDLQFHLNRISALAEALQEGQIPHRIQHSMVEGYGYATPLFYGELFLIFPAGLYLMGVPLQLAYQIFVVAVNLFTAGISYYCFERVTDDWKKGLFGSALYTCAIYRLLDVWFRASIGEYCAMMFFPLLWYGFYHIYTSRKKKYTIKDYLPIVLALTGIIQSHTLSCEMVAVFTVMFLIIYLKKTIEWKRFIALVKSVVFSFLLNLWFLFPLVQSMKMDIYVNTRETAKIGSLGYSIQQFLGVFSRQLSDNNVNYVQGGIGIALLLTIVLFLYCCLKRKEWSLKNTTVFSIAKINFFLAIVAMFLASKWCPWDNLYHINESLFDVAGMIQFPWRYMAFVCLFLTITGICSIWIIEEHMSHRCTVKIMVLTVGCCIFMSSYFMINGINDHTTAYKIYSTDALNTCDLGWNEYMLGNSIELGAKKCSEAEEGLNVGEVQYNKGTYQIYCTNLSKTEKYVSIPVLAYDNYHAYTVDGKELYIEEDMYGRIRFSVPGEYDGEVYIKYEEPISWRISEIISLCTLGGMIAIYICEKKGKIRV